MSKSDSDKGDWGGDSESLFDAARAAHDPTAADRARVRSALAERLASGAVTTTTSDAGAPAIAGKSAHGIALGNLVKLSVIVAMLMAGSFAIIRTSDRRSERPQPTAAVPPEPAPAVAPTPAPTPATVSALPRAQSTAAASHEAPGTLSNVRSPRANATVPASHPRVREPSRREHTHAAPAQRLTIASNAPADPAPMRGAAQPVATLRATATPDSDAIPDSDASPNSDATSAMADESVDARAELALVQRIHATMRDNRPATALALCSEHERRWPHGTFALEREGVRAIASCSLRAKDAAARARAFLAEYPRTPVAPRVAAACAAQLSVTLPPYP